MRDATFPVSILLAKVWGACGYLFASILRPSMGPRLDTVDTSHGSQLSLASPSSFLSAILYPCGVLYRSFAGSDAFKLCKSLSIRSSLYFSDLIAVRLVLRPPSPIQTLLLAG